MSRRGECEASECERPVRKLRWCSTHYQRFVKHGDANIVTRLQPDRDSYDDLIRRGITRAGECLLSNASKSSNGYRFTRVKQKTYLLHRVSYEKWHGPIPDGHVVDHMCHNEAAARGECDGREDCIHKACVNPAHLRAVTSSVNTTASPLYWASTGRWQKEKTHCPQRHPYSEENTYIYLGRRSCRICATVRDKKVREEEKATRHARGLKKTGPKLRSHCFRNHELTPENTYSAPSTGERACKECRRASALKAEAKKKALRENG